MNERLGIEVGEDLINQLHTTAMALEDQGKMILMEARMLRSEADRLWRLRNQEKEGLFDPR